MEKMMWSVSSHWKRLSIDGDRAWAPRISDVTTRSTCPGPAGTRCAPRVQQVVVPIVWPVWLPSGPFCVTWHCCITVQYTALMLNGRTNRASFNESMGFSVWISVCLPMLALSHENSHSPSLICTSCVLTDMLSKACGQDRTWSMQTSHEEAFVCLFYVYIFIMSVEAGLFHRF